MSLVPELLQVLPFPVADLQPLSGGDIAQAYRARTPRGNFFIKALEEPDALRMLEAEAGGLQALSRAGVLRVPGVEGVFDLPQGACLVLEYIESRPGTKTEFQAFGRQLAMLHQQPRPTFGWEEDNYIGRLPQLNTPDSDWACFYTASRLLPQYEMALSRGLLRPEDIPEQAQVKAWLRKRSSGVQPSLLHGDLWGGNFLFSQRGEAVLIDPAVYSGHSEADLAMTRLFGGFPEAFYQGYYSVLPPVAGHEERQALYQLYYLLVHLNLFGGSYRQSVCRIGSRLFGL